MHENTDCSCVGLSGYGSEEGIYELAVRIPVVSISSI